MVKKEQKRTKQNCPFYSLFFNCILKTYYKLKYRNVKRRKEEKRRERGKMATAYV